MHPQWFAIPQEYLKSDTPSQVIPPDASTAESLSLPEIPLNQMWPDDELWMPLLLKGQYFVGRVDFGIKNSDAQHGSWTMERWWFGTKS